MNDANAAASSTRASFPARPALERAKLYGAGEPILGKDLMTPMDDADPIWPDLAYSAWSETLATLQLWTQIVGKIRLTLTPWLNHSWQTPLYVTARGLGTSPIPIGNEIFEIEFDFIAHRLNVRTSRGAERSLPLRPQSVADFFSATLDLLNGMGVSVAIKETPNEVPNPIRFSEDRLHAAYDPAAAHRFWRALVQADRVFKLFRSGFIGKASPVHFFWGSFDLAVTRFSGRPRPAPSGRRAWTARRRGARSLFARSEQRRILAGERGFSARGLLFLRLSRAARLPRPEGFARRCVRYDAWESSSCPTRRSRDHPTRTACCSTSCRRLTPRQRMPQAGTAPLWNARLAFRDGSARSRRGLNGALNAAGYRAR